VLPNCLVDLNSILQWHRHGAALTTRGARATASVCAASTAKKDNGSRTALNSPIAASARTVRARYSVTTDGLIGVDTERLEQPDQDVDENREEDRNREGE
jgi:hypothetical protein